MSTPPCIVNPKTGKPFTRHRYEQRNLRVTDYTAMRSTAGQPTGELAPTAYAFELVCQRKGCEHSETCTY